MKHFVSVCCALAEIFYRTTASKQYRAEVNLTAFRSDAIRVCLDCLVNDARITRLIYKSSAMGEEIHYITSGTQPQLINLRALCETTSCHINVSYRMSLELDKGIALPNVQETGEIQPVVPQAKHRLCFLHSVNAPYTDCLSRAVPNWVMKYTNIVVHPRYGRKAVLTVFYTNSYDSDSILRCRSGYSYSRPEQLNKDICTELTQAYSRDNAALSPKLTSNPISTTSSSKKRKRVGKRAHSPSIHDAIKVPESVSNKMWTITKLIHHLNTSPIPGPTRLDCLSISSESRYILDCIKCIETKMGAKFGIAYLASSAAKLHLLLFHSTDTPSATNLCKNSHCKALVHTQIEECKMSSKMLYEYPVKKQDTMKHRSICATFDYNTYSQNKCPSRIKSLAGTLWKTATFSSLFMQNIVENEYDSSISAIFQQAKRLKYKCMIRIYSSELCSWHAKIIGIDSPAEKKDIKFKLPDLNQMPDTEPIRKLGSTHTIPSKDEVPKEYSALWPPCDDAPNVDTDPFKRLFVAVRLSIRGDKYATHKCFACISKRLEVFFINSERKEYIWMTQIPVADLHSCLDEKCLLQGMLMHCTRHVPSAHPLPVLSNEVQQELINQILVTDIEDDATTHS